MTNYTDITLKLKYAQVKAIQWDECEIDEYWNEKGMIALAQSAEKELLEATFQLHNMALSAVEIVVNDDNLLKLFGINKNLWPAVRYSWS